MRKMKEIRRTTRREKKGVMRRTKCFLVTFNYPSMSTMMMYLLYLKTMRFFEVYRKI
jgi:hypothetical protein